jgi:hypothetical protein
MSCIRKHQRAARPRRLSALRVRLMLAATLAVAASAIAAAPASAAEPGVNILNLNVPAQTADVTALGTHWVRLFMPWGDMEPSPGVWAQNWFAYYEGEIGSLPPGTKVILDMVGTPQWETGSADVHTPPANDGEFAAFVATIARHFGNRVAAYEIWNEEDASRWWGGGANPAAYANMLKAVYPAVKAAEPNAVVVLGGLTGNDYEYLEGVYQAGGKGSFDAVGVHTDTACNVQSPYEFLRWENGRMIDDSFLAYREVHAVMLANGDNRPIWMTELSWRTTGAACPEGAWAGKKPEGVTEQTQATYLAQAYHCLAQDPYVQVALWFPLQDEGGALNGLVRANGSRKPAFGAMQEYARSGDQLTEPCGVFSGPSITVASPGNRANYEGPLPIRVSAHSSAGVWRIRLLIDGHVIRNYDNMSYPSSLTGEIDWMGAKHIAYGWHTLTFLAYDRMHNVSQVSVQVHHGVAAAHTGHGKASKPSASGGHKHPRKHVRKHGRGRRHH